MSRSPERRSVSPSYKSPRRDSYSPPRERRVYSPPPPPETGYSRGRDYERGGYERGGYERDNYDRGYDRGGYDRYDRGGYGGGGYERGYERGGYERGGGYERRRGGYYDDQRDYYDRPSYDRGGPGGGFRGPPRKREVFKGNEVDRNTSKCLFVGNMPYSFREEEVTDLFEKCGKIESVSVPMDRYTGRNKGFAFVTFEDRLDAEDAKAKYESYTVDGRTLRIDWDVGRERKPHFQRAENAPPAEGEFNHPESAAY